MIQLPCRYSLENQHIKFDQSNCKIMKTPDQIPRGFFSISFWYWWYMVILWLENSEPFPPKPLLLLLRSRVNVGRPVGESRAVSRFSVFLQKFPCFFLLQKRNNPPMSLWEKTSRWVACWKWSVQISLEHLLLAKKVWWVTRHETKRRFCVIKQVVLVRNPEEFTILLALGLLKELGVNWNESLSQLAAVQLAEFDGFLAQNYNMSVCCCPCPHIICQVCKKKLFKYV